MVSLTSVAEGLLSQRSVITVPVVLAVGFISTLKNPCAIPLYPAVSATCLMTTGEVDLASKRRVTFLASATLFVLGLALSTTVLGLAVIAAGRVVGVARWGRYFIALIPMLMGMSQLGWLQLPRSKLSCGKTFRPGLGGAFATGLLLSLVIGGCGGAALASLLAYAAYHQAYGYGGVLLFAYGIGAGIPLITCAAVVGNLSTWLDRKGYRQWLQRGLGGSMIALGFYLVWLA